VRIADIMEAHHGRCPSLICRKSSTHCSSTEHQKVSNAYSASDSIFSSPSPVLSCAISHLRIVQVAIRVASEREMTM
jgi:hypothetical protein